GSIWSKVAIVSMTWASASMSPIGSFLRCGTASLGRQIKKSRHGRACPGHPRARAERAVQADRLAPSSLVRSHRRTARCACLAWMAGSSPAMTIEFMEAQIFIPVRLSHRREFGQGDVGRDRLEADGDRHVAAHLLGCDADDVADDARPLLELDQPDDIGQLAGEARMVMAVVGDEAEDLAAAADLDPFVARLAAGAAMAAYG